MSETGRATVSVVIPCFNQEAFIAEAIRSVLQQGPIVRELVVVDDGSTDRSGAVIAGFDEARMVRQANRGVAHARNLGLAETSGPFVLFLDADDRLAMGALDMLTPALEALPQHAFVYGQARVIGVDGELLRVPEGRCPEGDAYASLLRANTIWSPGAVLYRRSAIEAVRGFDPAADMAADYALNLRLARQYPIHCIADLVVEYRVHGTNASGDPARMLRTTMVVMQNERPHTRGDPRLEQAWSQGVAVTRSAYGEGAIESFKKFASDPTQWRAAAKQLSALLRYYPAGLAQHAGRFLRNTANTLLRRN